MAEQVVVGVDGGGTSTRAVVADETGTVRGDAEGGGANPQHNPLSVAHGNVQATIRRALDEAEVSPESVAALTAGLAGLNSEDDQRWARSLVTLPGLSCDPVCVNDAVVAHRGALRSKPGVVAICGTGSIVFGITSSGRQVRNYDVDHYADAAARHLGRRFVHRLLGGRFGPADRSVIDAALDRWGLEDLTAVRREALDGDLLSTDDSGNALDSVAPQITEAAAGVSPLARSVCNDAAAEVATGIEAVGGFFETESIDVALTGGVLQSRYVHESVRELLDAGANTYRVVDPAMTPVAGAAYSSLERVGVTDLETAAKNLRGH